MPSCTGNNHTGGRRGRNKTQNRKRRTLKNRRNRSRKMRRCTCKGVCKCGRKCRTCGKSCCNRKYMGG